ncbi:unnamed protein product [Trichobilharzia regenti]|nr:unnamed protein product [Trichobilharzia regenti]
MRTNGKVDKEYLRQYYYSKYYCDIPEISKPIQPTWRSETIRKIIDNNIIPCSITKRADQANHQNTVDFQVMKSRERARKVLAEVLGIYNSNGDVIPATEQLRQLGFNADLDIFTRTGKIGSILSYLEKSEPDYEKKKEEALVVNSWRKDIPWHKIFKRSQTCNAIYRIHLVENDWGESPKIYPLGNYEIFIEEWNNEKGCGTKRQEIVDTLVNAFIEKDRLSHALKLDRGDLQEAVEAFLGNHKPNLGIVLTARYYCQNSCEQVLEQDKLVGALISLPVSHVPSLNRTPKLEILQHYFDSPYSNSKYLQSYLPNWKKISLKLLARLETDLLRIAAKRGFAGVVTLNTSEVTEEICSQLGYQMVQTTTLKSFMTSEKRSLPPQYERMRCAYMSKELISSKYKQPNR